MARSLKEISRGNWTGGEPATMTEIQTGCLQRIAESTEAMARYHVRLMEERDCYRLEVEGLRKLLAYERHRVAALQGVITKLKRSK